VRSSLLLLCLTFCAAAPLAGQGDATLDLRVSESAGTPLRGVHVDVLGRRLGSVTDSHGHVLIRRVPAGTQFVRVQRIGYETQSLTLDVEPGDTVQLDLTLSTSAIPLDTVRAAREAQVPALARNGFYERQKVGLGHFVTERELSRVPDEPTHSIFRRIPGVDAVAVGNYWILVSTRGPVSPRGIGCPVRLFVDGIPWRDDLDAVQHQDIEAIEVYASPSEIPPQYGGANSACGVVLIWTHH
jgi:CarboxypepD_reg-like domain